MFVKKRRDIVYVNIGIDHQRKPPVNMLIKMMDFAGKLWRNAFSKCLALPVRKQLKASPVNGIQGLAYVRHKAKGFLPEQV